MIMNTYLTYQSIWDVANTVLREKFTALNAILAVSFSGNISQCYCSYLIYQCLSQSVFLTFISQVKFPRRMLNSVNNLMTRSLRVG